MAEGAFDVGIRFFAENEVSRVLSRMAGELKGLDSQVAGFSKNLKNITSGVVKLGVAFGMAEFIADLVKANGLLERQVGIFKLAGNSEVDAIAMRRAAYDSAVKVRGVGVVEQAKLLRELSSALQDNPGARGVLPDFARSKAIISFATGRDNDDDTTRLAKMIELRGGAVNTKTEKIDPQLFRKELDAATKAIVVGQGLLTTNDLQQMIKQGGPAMKNFRGNPEAFWSSYLAMAEDMGGARAGTATTAIARQVLGGIMTPKVAAEWERLGMYNKEGQGWHHDKKGKVVIDDPSKAIRGYQDFVHGGLKDFIDKDVRPAFKSHGINTPEQQNAEMYQFGSTETARRAYGLYMSNDPQIKAVIERYNKAMGSKEGFDKVVSKDMLYNLDSIGTSIHTLATALGSATTVAPMLGSIADGINKIAKAASEHPDLGKAITIGGGAAAGVLGVAGAAQVAKGVAGMVSGFGLPAAATQLSVAATALDAAAVRLGAGGAAGAVAGGLAGAPAVAASAGIGVRILSSIPLVTTAVGFGAAFVGVLNAYKEAHPEEFRARIRGADQHRFDSEKGGVLHGGAQYGPFRHWEQPPGRNQGYKGHWVQGLAEQIGKQTGTATVESFKKVDFAGTGSATGLATTKGFTAIDFTGAGAMAGNAVASGFLKAAMALSGGGGIGGAGGLIRASYGGGGGGGGTWNGHALAVGGGVGIGHTASQAERAAFIKAYAAKIGIDPTTALRVAQSEGFNTYVGDHGMSFGDFQMYTGGGLGNVAARHGIDVRDPHKWMQADKFALDWARTHGWGDWHGAARVGIGRHQGIGMAPRMPPPQKHQQTIHTNVHLDGKIIAKIVTKHQTASSSFPTQAPYHNRTAYPTPPDIGYATG